MTRKLNVMYGFSAQHLLEIKNRYDYTISIVPARYGRNNGYLMAQDPALRSPYPRYLYSKLLDMDYLHRITGL